MHEQSSEAFGLNTYKEEHVKKKVIQPLVESLDLPELPVEVLELVCTYLSEATLRYSVNLVCKKWHEVSNRSIRRAGIWKPVEGRNELLLSRWPRISSLELWFNQNVPHYWEPAYVTTKTAFWNAFVTAITEPRTIKNQGKAQHNDDDDDNFNANGDSDTDPSAPSCLLHTIRHLKVRGLYMIYTEVASDLRGHLQFIESLTIKLRASPEPIPLFTILEDFLALRSFSLEFSSTFDEFLNHGDDEDKNEAVVIVVDGPPKLFPERYQLQRFCIDEICTDLRVLERLLVTCPDLRVFQATDIDLTTRPKGSDLSREEKNAEERKARQRLIVLAAKHCPKLKWYSFHTYFCASDKEDLRAMARTLPDQKMQSIISHGYLDSVTDDTLGLQDLLGEITVLEIRTNFWFGDASDTLNRILCLTPNLLHLKALRAGLDTNDLWKPPVPAIKPTKNFVVAPVGNRKRRERNARRRSARELALTDSRPSVPAADVETPVAVIDTPVAVIDPSISVTWQVYNLRTLELGLHRCNDIVAFADYISRYRLFRNLVTLVLGIGDLKVGQRQSFSNNPTATAASDEDSKPLLEPLRYPNELLALRSLRCLEECTLRASVVPGVISIKNFKFLMRTESFQAVFPLPVRMNENKRKKAMRRRNNNSVLKTMTATDNDENADNDEEEEGGGGEEEDEEEWKDETFWPKLTTFHIIYCRISPSTDTRKLVRRLHYIRPGVAFSFHSRV